MTFCTPCFLFPKHHFVVQRLERHSLGAKLNLEGIRGINVGNGIPYATERQKRYVRDRCTELVAHNCIHVKKATLNPKGIFPNIFGVIIYKLL